MNSIRCHKQNDSPNRNDLSSFLKVVQTMWRLSGELAVNCSTLVDLPRQTHGLRWMRDELMAPPDRRLTLNGADDVQHWRQTLSGRTSILALLHLGSRAPAHTTYTGCPSCHLTNNVKELKKKTFFFLNVLIKDTF